MGPTLRGGEVEFARASTTFLSEQTVHTHESMHNQEAEKERKPNSGLESRGPKEFPSDELVA